MTVTHRYTIITLDCKVARGACALGTGLTRPFCYDIGRQIYANELTMY